MVKLDIPKNTSHNKHMRREVSMGQFITMHARQKCLNSLLFIFLNGAKPKPLNGWGWPRQFSSFYGVRSLIIVIRKPLPNLYRNKFNYNKKPSGLSGVNSDLKNSDAKNSLSRLSNIRAKTGKKCNICVFRLFLPLCRTASQPYRLR